MESSVQNKGPFAPVSCISSSPSHASFAHDKQTTTHDESAFFHHQSMESSERHSFHESQLNSPQMHIRYAQGHSDQSSPNQAHFGSMLSSSRTTAQNPSTPLRDQTTNASAQSSPFGPNSTYDPIQSPIMPSSPFQPSPPQLSRLPHPTLIPTSISQPPCQPIQHSPPRRPYHEPTLASPHSSPFINPPHSSFSSSVTYASLISKHISKLEASKRRNLHAFRTTGGNIKNLTRALQIAWNHPLANEHMAQLYDAEGRLAEWKRMHDAYGRAVRRVEYELEECWGDLWVPDPAILMQFRKEGENMEEKSEDQDSGAWSTEDESDED